MAGRFARLQAPLQRPLPERWQRRPSKRQYIDLTAELLRSRMDNDDARRELERVNAERARLSAELAREQRDSKLKDEVITKMRERLARFERGR